MTQAKRDNNQITTLIGTLNSDGITPTLVKGSPTDHSIYINDDTTGSDLSGDNAARDDNSVPVLLATSSVDGVTPVPVYVNSDNELLVNSN